MVQSKYHLPSEREDTSWQEVGKGIKYEGYLQDIEGKLNCTLPGLLLLLDGHQQAPSIHFLPLL